MQPISTLVTDNPLADGKITLMHKHQSFELLSGLPWTQGLLQQQQPQKMSHSVPPQPTLQEPPAAHLLLCFAPVSSCKCSMSFSKAAGWRLCFHSRLGLCLLQLLLVLMLLLPAGVAALLLL